MSLLQYLFWKKRTRVNLKFACYWCVWPYVSQEHHVGGTWSLLFCGFGFMAAWRVVRTGRTRYRSLKWSLNILALVPAEGLPHPVSGARAGEPQSCAGYKKQTAPPTGEEDDRARQTGESWDLASGQAMIQIREKKQQHWTFFCLFVFLYQRDKNVKLDESLKKVQQENEDLKARMDRHAALSR